MDEIAQGQIHDTISGATGLIKQSAESPNFLPGQVLGALSLNKFQKEFISLGDLIDMGFDRDDPFSIALWMKTTDATSIIFSKLGKGPAYTGYELLLLNHELAFYLVNRWNPPGQRDSIGIRADQKKYNDNQWHWVVATYDGSGSQAGLKLFIDGIAPAIKPGQYITQNELVGSIKTDAEVEIGYRADHDGYYYTGLIDEVMVYDRQLTTEEIASLFSAQQQNAAIGLCKPTSSCGNQIIEWQEDCDDGNTEAGNGCSAVCSLEKHFSCQGEPSYCSSIPCSTPPDSLTHWWPLDQADGNLVKDLQANSDGTLINNPIFTKGMVDQGLELKKANNQYIGLGNLEDTNFDKEDPFSIALWIRSTDSTSIILAKMGSNYTGYELLFLEQELAFYLCSRWFPEASRDCIGAHEAEDINYNKGQDYWVVATYDGSGLESGLKLFVNGAVVSVKSPPAKYKIKSELQHSILTTAELEIGDRASDDLFRYTGLIDEVMIFNQALSADTIKAIYKAGARGVCKDPTCDNQDDDEDGVIDEDYLSTELACGQGACAAIGKTSCVGGAEKMECPEGNAAPQDLLCDGIDEDCDGQIDEECAPSSNDVPKDPDANNNHGDENHDQADKPQQPMEPQDGGTQDNGSGDTSDDPTDGSSADAKPGDGSNKGKMQDEDGEEDDEPADGTAGCSLNHP